MRWPILLHEDFEPEFDALPEDAQDEMLAHAKLLEQFGGSGEINPETGLPEYKINWGKLKSWLSKPQNLATLAAVAFRN